MAHTVRKATDGDLAAITKLIRRAYSKYLSRMDRPPAPMLRDYRACIRDGTVWVLGEPPIGMLSLETLDNAVLIENVAVDPKFQGTGVGRQLMDFAEEQARQHGLQTMVLFTNEVMFEDLAIYRHLGYHEVDRKVEDGYRRVFMEKRLG